MKNELVKHNPETNKFVFRELASSDHVLSEINCHQRKNFKATVRRFNDFLAERDLIVNSDSIEEYKDYLKFEKELKASSINTILGRLRRVVKLQPDIKNNSILKKAVDDIFKNATKFKDDKKIGINRYLTQDELRLVYEKCKNPTIALVVKFITTTGLRVTEALDIKIKDIQPYGQQNVMAFTVVGKNTKERSLTVKKELVVEIIRTCESKIYLFETRINKKHKRTYISREVKKLISAHLFGKIGSVHILRHTFATLALQAGQSIKWISQALGHASTAITQDMYIHENHMDTMTDVIVF